MRHRWLGCWSFCFILCASACVGCNEQPEENEDVCAGVTCNAGEVCKAGKCEAETLAEDKCKDVTCKDGEVCKNGKCEAETPVEDELECTDVICWVDGWYKEKCDADSFVSECYGSTYSECEDGYVVYLDCPDNMACHLIECDDESMSCKPKYECIDEAALCDSENFKDYCDEDDIVTCTKGVIEYLPCDFDKICYNGLCIFERKIGKTCDATFMPVCDGNVRLSCENGEIKGFDCRQKELWCLYGECVALKDSSTWCTSDAFCIDNSLVSCEAVIDCDDYKGGICTSIDGTLGCYTTCKEENENVYACTDEKFFSFGDCVKSDDGKFYVLKEKEADEANKREYFYCAENNICLNDDCVDISNKVQDWNCDDNFERGICLEDTLVRCSWNGWYARKCDQNEFCIEYEDTAACVETCSQKDLGKIRTYCEPPYYSFQDECRELNGKYYWINIESDKCSSYGCNEFTGLCFDYYNTESCDLSEQTRKVCKITTYGFSSAYGGQNIFQSESFLQKCEDHHWTDVDSYSTNGYNETCPHGCNIETGECIKFAEWEGEKCEEDMRECRDNFVVYCDSEFNSFAYSCGEWTCADNDEYYTSCYEPCELDEIGKRKDYECDDRWNYQRVRFYECVEVVNSDNKHVYIYVEKEEDCTKCDDTSKQCID